MSPRPEDRPSAEKVLASPLLTRQGGSPQPAGLAQQPTASAQSAATVVAGEPAAAAPAAAAAGGGKQFGGLVLQKSMAR